jgi:glycosyltransferase involved in cell wall biosynthesis
LSGDPADVNIAFLTGISIRSCTGGGSVHVSQVAEALHRRGHRLYTNLPGEPDIFNGSGPGALMENLAGIQAFYIRIDGWPERDNLTQHRRINRHAPCIWEVNAPVEEMRNHMVSESRIDWFNRRRRALALLADTAICVSEEMEDYARSFLGIRKTFLVPNGSNPGIFSPERSDPSLYGTDRFNVIWIGSAEYRWQGIDLVRKAAERLLPIDKEIRFLVTAEGRSTENLRYLGKIPYDDVPRHVASADIGLCIYENIDYYPRFYFSPLKLYDYMASGLPVLGTDVGQIRRVIEEHGSGILAGNSIEDIVSGLLRLKKDDRARREMGARGRAAVADRYNWGSIASRTEEIMSEAHERAGKGGVPGAIRYFIASGLAERYRPHDGMTS